MHIKFPIFSTDNQISLKMAQKISIKIYNLENQHRMYKNFYKGIGLKIYEYFNYVAAIFNSLRGIAIRGD